MRIIPEVLLSAFVFAACSCSWSGKQAGGPVIAPEEFRKEAITIRIKADAKLNQFERNPHTLYLCVYQLKEPNGFNQLAEENGGLPKLLECSRFDGSVANAKQFVIQPGEELRDVRDRAEGARYIGIATGYYGTGKGRLTELFPLVPPQPGNAPGILVGIELGSHQISDVKVR